MMRHACLLLIVLCSSHFHFAHAAAWQQSGRIGLESRYFIDAEAVQSGLLAEPEWYWHTEDSRDSFTLTLFGRIDSEDDERSHADVREALWLHVGEGWEFRAGLGKVFWGVTESVHLVDIINQTDAVESADGEQKLGQPLLQYTTIADWGVLDFFVLPYFRERTFPGEDGYLSGGVLIDTDAARYEDDDEQHHVDFALRYSQSFSVFDLGVSAFNGTNRDPILTPVMVNEQLVFNPYYDQITQLGLDLQATVGDWLWKLEAIGREDSQRDFAAYTAGFEYTLVGIAGTATDMGLLLEYSHDSRAELAPTPFQRDLFIGSRFTLNDVQSTELLLGIALDTEDSDSYLAFAEGSRRFGNRWRVTLDARVFSGKSAADPLFVLDRGDYVSLTVECFY